jgi:uncharacterized protein (TIGR03083 family)
MTRLVGGLTDDQLTLRSYADEWSLAQVASHLGSQAEIFDLFLTAGLTGADAPDGDTFVPIWDRWNALPPRSKIASSVAANEHLVSRLEGLTDAEQGSFALPLFGSDLDIAGLAALRLGEHVLHTWDIAVALDPAATIAQDAVDLLIDTLPQRAAAAGTPVPGGSPLEVVTSEPLRAFHLTLDPAVTLTARDAATPDAATPDAATPDAATPDAATPDAAVARFPAEAFIRLVAGRLDPDHTPLGVDAGDRLDQLRQAFPGF